MFEVNHDTSNFSDYVAETIELFQQKSYFHSTHPAELVGVGKVLRLVEAESVSCFHQFHLRVPRKDE